jgi:hypothetical protein
MKRRFYQRIFIFSVLVLLWSVLVPGVASSQQDSIVISDNIRVLTNSEDASGGSEFGSAVAIDGSTLAIGALLADNGGVSSGAAFLHNSAESIDVQQTQNKLTESDDPHNYDYFGNSLAISGDLLAIGASRDDINGADSGAVYVTRFSYDEGSWTTSEQTRLTPSDPVANSQFGNSVAVSGNTVVVGTYWSEAVYVFEYDDLNLIWEQKAKLTAIDAQGGEKFGISVAIDGDTIAVGASNRSKGDLKTGSVFVFRYIDSDWQYETELFGSDLAKGDKFGSSVAFEGDTIIVGAPYQDSVASNTGAAYVFRRDAGTWIEEAKLIGSALSAGALFGNSVGLSGDTAVIGAYRNYLEGYALEAEENILLKDAGSAYLFRFEGDGWNPRGILPFDGNGGEEFGWAVAISGDTVVVGAHKDGNLSGSAYVYALAPENHPPVADAGEDQEVEEGSLVTLDGSDSYDLDGDDLIYSWTQIGEPHVGLDLTDEAKPTFNAPDSSGENMILKFQLVVYDDKDYSETDEVQVTVLPSTTNVTEINSVLDRHHRPWGVDKDIYTFSGTKGDKVTVTLKAKTGGKNNNGDRATLKLKDNIWGVSFYRVDSSRLPNHIYATLPATGQYHILVAGQPRFFRGRRFLGEYTLTLEGASGSVEKGAGTPVAHNKPGRSAKPHKQHPVWSWISSWFRH